LLPSIYPWLRNSCLAINNSSLLVSADISHVPVAWQRPGWNMHICSDISALWVECHISPCLYSSLYNQVKGKWNYTIHRKIVTPEHTHTHIHTCMHSLLYIDVIRNTSFCTIYKSFVSPGFKRYNGSLVAWTVVSFAMLSQIYITNDGQSASLSWLRSPSGFQDKIFVTVRHSRVCWCGAPSLTGGRFCQFTIAAGHRQLIHSRVRVPRDSWPYFTSSDSRLLQPGGARFPYSYLRGTGWSNYTPRHWVPFSSPPTTRRATEEVFESASTRG
jgi:hypothetical protein